MPGWADGAWSPVVLQLAGRTLVFNRAGRLLLQTLTRLITGSSRSYSLMPVFVSESTLGFFFVFFKSAKIDAATSWPHAAGRLWGAAPVLGCL